MHCVIVGIPGDEAQSMPPPVESAEFPTMLQAVINGSLKESQ
jgi:hypothetical protein